jgi:hypothetical protein
MQRTKKERTMNQLLEQNPDKICWFNLCSNPSIFCEKVGLK